MQLQYRSALSTHLPDCYLLRMADEPSLLAEPSNKPRNCLDLIFNDCYEAHGLVKAPTEGLARQIAKFFHEAIEAEVPYFVAQCQMGVGRSQAVIAACQARMGMDNSVILRAGSYNRKLYKLLMEEFGIPVKEPLVSIVVRVKYDVTRLEAFMLSMERQRYQNWEVIAVSDGWNSDLAMMANWKNLWKIQTKERKGRWGHPYRQLGIDAARGEYIGLQNDDNYLSPGFVEQLVYVLEQHRCGIAACEIVHSYMGYRVAPAGMDLGSWIAKASLVRSVPFDGTGPYADAEYLIKLQDKGTTEIVKRALVVHN